MNTKLEIGKIEFENPHSIHLYFKERRRDEIKRIEKILTDFEIEKHIIDKIISEIELY